jgi:energy-coupling factor transport system permease protein
MAFFDNLQRVSVGQYIPSASPVHKLDPRTRITIFLMLITAVTLSPSVNGLVAAILFSILLLLFSRISVRDAFSKLRVPLPLILLLALLQLFITRHAPGDKMLFSFWVLNLTETGLRAAAMLFMRFVALVWLFSAAGATISNIDMIYGIDLLFKPLQKIGMHTHSLTMTIQMMLRFIPYLIFNAEKIAKSQASRGASWDDPRGGILQRARQILPLIVPLFNTSLQQADTLARAMVARAYGASNRRTGLREYQLTIKDVLITLLCAAAACAILFLP